MAFIAAVMFHEWAKMTEQNPKFLFAGLAIISIPIASLICARMLGTGKYDLLLYFIALWSVDSFAMLGGKTFGGPKLAPILSPNKTWSGLLVGVFCCASTLLLATHFLPGSLSKTSSLQVFFFGVVLALLAQSSDLFISFFKRKCGIKDSGNIIPGHGGMLDRFDSIILTAPLVYIILILCTKT